LKGRYFSAARTLAQETASISNAPLGLEEQLQLIYKLHASDKSWLQRARRLCFAAHATFFSRPVMQYHYCARCAADNV
jgi:hypothetical protein